MSHPGRMFLPGLGNGAGAMIKLGGGMETFLGSLGTVVAVYLMLRAELRDVRGELREEIRGLRGEIRDVRIELGGKIDRLGEQLLQHVQQGHPPHQAA